MLLLAPEVTRFLDFDCLLPWMDIVRSSSDKFLNTLTSRFMTCMSVTKQRRTSFRTTIAKLEKQGKKSRRKLAWVSNSVPAEWPIFSASLGCVRFHSIYHTPASDG